MKLPLIPAVLALALCAPTAHAQSSEIDALCSSLYDFAEIAMTVRQNGAPLPKAIEILDKHKDAFIYPSLRSILDAAYSEPRWSGEETRARAIQDFSNDVAAICYGVD